MLALQPNRLLTPEGFAEGQCLLIEGDRIAAFVPLQECPVEPERLEGDLLPGFIDLQVNGGGGVLFNDRPDVEGIAAIGRAHRRFGTTGFLPTLITDKLDVVDRAMRAVEEAIDEGVPGVLGIHIEGPFINPERKGIHDAAKIRRIDDEAIELLCSLRSGATLVTLAPELAPAGAIRRLVEGGVTVAAGHSAATYEQVRSALDEGLSGFTHLYNAMSQLTGREPGMVGAALASDAWCGVIVDGFHVHPASLRIALAAKGEERIVLVSDAMPTTGWDGSEFELGGRPIRAEGGRLTGADGTLAGSALDMAQAVANARSTFGIGLESAVRMASLNPARAMGLSDCTGSIRIGLSADLVLLDESGRVRRTWIAGREG